jgi:hypothetical protein
MDNFFLIIGVVLVVLVALYIKTYMSKKAAPSPTPAPNPSPAPVASGGTAPPALPAGIDTPDLNGRVALTGLPAGNYYTKIRFAIYEVAKALPDGDAKRDAQANIAHANGEYNIAEGMITVCYPLVKAEQSAADKLDTSKPITDTLALPSFMTVAAATAHFAVLPDPNTKGNGGFVPKH